MTRHLIVSALAGLCGLTLVALAFSIVRRSSGVLPCLSPLAALLVVATLATGAKAGWVLSFAAAVVLVIGDVLLQLFIYRLQPPARQEMMLVIACFLASMTAVHMLVFIAGVTDQSLPTYRVGEWYNGGSGTGVILGAVVTLAAALAFSNRLNQTKLVTASRLARRDHELLWTLGISPLSARMRAFVVALALIFLGVWLLCLEFDSVHVKDFVVALLVAPATIALSTRSGLLRDIVALCVLFALAAASFSALGFDTGWARVLGLAGVSLAGVGGSKVYAVFARTPANAK